MIRPHKVFKDVKPMLERMDRASPEGDVSSHLLEGLVDGQFEYRHAWEDLRFPAQTVKRGEANPPNWVHMSALGNLYTLEFDPSTEEDVYLFAQLPHSWKEGSEIRPHVHWINNRSGSGNIVWGLEYSIANPGVPGGTYPPSTSIEVVSPVPDTQFTHVIAPFPSIDMTGFTLSTILIMRLFRKATDSQDTCTKKIGMLEIDIHFQVDATGSELEYIKHRDK